MMKIEEAIEKQRAKPSKIKAKSSQPTCKNCLYVCDHYNATQHRDSFGNIPFPSDQHHISDLAKWR